MCSLEGSGDSETGQPSSHQEVMWTKKSAQGFAPSLGGGTLQMGLPAHLLLSDTVQAPSAVWGSWLVPRGELCSPALWLLPRDSPCPDLCLPPHHSV